MEEDIKILEELKEFLLSTNHEPQYNISQYTNAIENLIKRNKELEEELREEKDLTTIYLNGFYDGEQKWKDKIREIFDNYSQSSLMENNTFLEFKKELLEE